jgi:hypothetical protein
MPFDVNAHIFRSPYYRSIIAKAEKFFRSTPVIALPPADDFDGCGVYALYYIGSYKLYKPIADKNAQGFIQPIYVGKAVPTGWRKGRALTSENSILWSRLREHARSIAQARNLRLSNFRCRFVILNQIESDLIVPLEAELIRVYQPLWNQVVDGFGNHDPGSGRYYQAISEWDILHPGRTWVANLKGDRPDLGLIKDKIKEHLR